MTNLGELPEDDRALTAVVTSRGDEGRTVGKWLGKVERHGRKTTAEPQMQCSVREEHGTFSMTQNGLPWPKTTVSNEPNSAEDEAAEKTITKPDGSLS